jgi:hypothetical protein
MRGEPAGGALHERLAGALCELLRGFDEADREAGGALLGPRSTGALGAFLAGLVTALLRTIVLAFATERGLLTCEGGTAPAEIHAALDRERQRGSALRERGAWTTLVGAFRAVHTTCGGGLFDPKGFPFLERGGPRDAVVMAVLDRLLFVGGDRIRWAELEVEEIGAAYEALVGLELHAAAGDSLVLLPGHVGVDLEDLLAVPGPERALRVGARAGVAAGARLAAALTRADSVGALRLALARRVSPRWPDLVRRGELFVEPGKGRRRSGAHYTPRAITRLIVERVLGPLLDRGAHALDLRICDPAMGSGAFLVEACRQLGDRLAAAGVAGARQLVAQRGLYGVDRDPIAVELARVSLWLVAEARDLPLSFADHTLRAGDALLGEGWPSGRGSLPTVGSRPTPPAPNGIGGAGSAGLDWPGAFPEVFERGGFDAFVGNPPWVAYAGRAAQPLAGELFDFYRRHYSSFSGYRTLHALFVERAASLIRPGGRLGLVVPTSISDLAGYQPARRAHDALCETDAELPDFGDAFDGVFQPSMGLLSTRRPAPSPSASGDTWRVARDDLDSTARVLLDRLAALPPLPVECFGERGFQTTAEDAARLALTGVSSPPFIVPIREGADVRAFRALPPRLHLDPSGLAGRLRASAAFRAVAVLVRQTARFPVAALGDGLAFRNSILAGFPSGDCDRFALCAWLNAAPIRWLHFMRYRDARQGMPQVKVAHLRSIPRIPGEHLAELTRLGADLGARNEGASASEQRALDDAAGSALGLSDAERALVAAWAEDNPAP